MAIFQINTTTLLKKFKYKSSALIPLKKKQQIFFLDTLSQLLDKGFSINQAFSFMGLLMRHQQASLEHLNTALRQGYPFEKALQDLGFNLTTVANLFYAQRQGRLHAALAENATRLKYSEQQHKAIIKQISYPLVMTLFLVLLLFGMRSFLLPYIMTFITEEIYQQNPLIRVLVLSFTYLPHLLISLLALIMLIGGLVDLYLTQQTQLTRYTLLSHYRITRKWTQWRCTYQFAYTFGYFFQSGFSLRQALSVIIQYPINPFLSEIANSLDATMTAGQSLTESLQQFPFFTEELVLMIYQGELTSQVATQCLLYADKLSTDFHTDIAKKISYLQPILFILIGVLVLAMYLIIMLPMLTMEIQ